ncbi:MAG: endonuclease/exonuclease/phosphatase family protein [Hydrogenovibrio sp.]|uniref:endonuclease/exonuclease/phosphatase family protein n=1 Tax=Hydrogenovibrio sp. TaxID=2065821 RepID=UPI002870491C|nr:endonuclease/exonuclease/phosphatase family protein [Hydrogenovibrio sp.]MDR9499418.1 endonuclease/exonuclease/phosphatase family protein [Hydrogenovibrio sp.]
MYRPTHTPISPEFYTDPNTSAVLPNPFELVAWNVQKTDFTPYSLTELSEVIPVPKVDLLSMQEARTQDGQPRFFNLPYLMAPNLQRGGRHYGVVTASRVQMQAQAQCLTQSRELGWATHKTALITRHPMPDGQWLTHLNIHAINFVSHALFKQELQTIWRHLAEHSGPMILSGDFNSWNRTRAMTLQKATDQLGLKKVAYPSDRGIRRLNRQPLDHVFYRGLEVVSAEVLSVPHISDHNPLSVCFAMLDGSAGNA